MEMVAREVMELREGEARVTEVGKGRGNKMSTVGKENYGKKCKKE